MKKLEKGCIYILIFSFFFTVMPKAAPQERAPGIIYQQELEKKTTKMFLYIVELNQGKYAALIEVSKKSASKIQGISVENSNGINYEVADIRNMPWKQVADYLNGIVPGSGSITSEITQPEIRKNTAHIGFMGVDVDSGRLSDWVTAGVFTAAEKTTKWQAEIKYYQDGKKGKIKSKEF